MGYPENFIGPRLGERRRRKAMIGVVCHRCRSRLVAREREALPEARCYRCDPPASEVLS